LSGASVGTATVDYQTADGTATSPEDYAANSGTLTFASGTTSQTITVAINGDATDEGQDETFVVNLSNAGNAAITDGQGQGTIVNDDAPVPPTQYTLTVIIVGSGSVSLSPSGGTYNAGTPVTLTPQSGAGFQFSGWSGDLSGSDNPATITMDANKNVTATFTASGGSSGQVVFEEIKTGGSSSSTTVTTSEILTAAGGHLYLAAIAKKSNVAVSSVSGLGLNWTLVKAQCSGRNQTGVEIWMAQGAPSGNGAVTATLAATPSNAVIAVSRYSGVDAVNPIGNIISGNTMGVNGACSGGTDNSSYSFNLTTTGTGAVIYGAVAMRSHTNTPGAGYTERGEIRQGSSSGSQASVAVQDKSVASAGTYIVDGTFDSSADWAAAALEIKPQIIISKNITADDYVTPASSAAFKLAQNDPNPFTTSTTIGFSLPVACNVTLEVHDAADQLMRTLISGEMAPGQYSVNWDGNDQFNRPVAAGDYFYKIDIEDEDGNFLFRETRRMTMIALPSAFELEQNYPNPFNPSTQIRFGLPQASHVTIKVYALNGAEVRKLVDEHYPAGTHTITFNTNNLPSGAYFYVMEAGSVRQVRRFTLLK
jgi:uncharacterized repeat protein (TIGR02543 family)